MKSYLEGKHKGKSLHRLKDNPEEKRFARAWEEMCDRSHLEYLLGDGKDPAQDVTERDALVAATVIQWLGSPVGRGFLEELGYTKSKSQWIRWLDTHAGQDFLEELGYKKGRR